MDKFAKMVSNNIILEGVLVRPIDNEVVRAAFMRLQALPMVLGSV